MNNALRPGEHGIVDPPRLRMCDAMPPLLRRLMKYAPFDYAVTPWALEAQVRLQRGENERGIAADWVARMRRGVAQTALRDYGPDHPQAPAQGEVADHGA